VRAAPSGLDAVTEADVREALVLYNRAASPPLPLLEPPQVALLLDGTIVKVRETPGGPEAPQRVVGYVLFDIPRPQVWIAATDPHSSYSGGTLRETRLVDDDAGTSVWYQHLDLPWPFDDRHWLIRVRKHRELAVQTENRVWEHGWSLDEKGAEFVPQFIEAGHIRSVTKDEALGAIYTPVNRGGWIMFEMPGNCTLLAYHVTSVVGGSIPDGVFTHWAMLTLESLLRQVGEFAREIPTHYVDGHAIVHGGDGAPLPLYGRAP
jgi:hypothetical protein